VQNKIAIKKGLKIQSK